MTVFQARPYAAGAPLPADGRLATGASDPRRHRPDALRRRLALAGPHGLGRSARYPVVHLLIDWLAFSSLRARAQPSDDRRALHRLLPLLQELRLRPTSGLGQRERAYEDQAEVS